MPLSDKHIQQLERTIKAMQEIVANAKKPAATRSGSPAKKMRRSGKELIAFQKMLVGERKSGISVAELAVKYGVSTAYVYQLPVTASKGKTANVKSRVTNTKSKSTVPSKRKIKATSAQANGVAEHDDVAAETTE